MTVLRIGERVRLQPQTFGADLGIPATYPGTITYIHPSGRWYQVTFDNGIKECFFVDPEPEPPHKGHPIRWA